MPIKIVIFLILSTVLIYLSRKSLFDHHNHGFYRFFIFEFLLILILLNLDRWFFNPFSVIQIISWLLLISSLFLALYGFYLIRTGGKPENGYDNTTWLITRGAYKYIRHPLYCSLLIGGIGAFLKDPSVSGFILLLLICAAAFATAKTEELENLGKFPNYGDYRKKTRMFIPRIF